MKKSITVLLVLVLALPLVACSQKPQMTASEIVLALQDAGLPIDNIIEYTAETDPNESLGRPGSYTQKVNFADTRLDQYDSSDPQGGTVEVFENKEDATNRREYVEEISETMPVIGYYCYQVDNVLLRVQYNLTPTEAAEYEAALNQILE